MKISELKDQGIADRACGSFADLLIQIRDVDAMERRDIIANQNHEYWMIHHNITQACEKVATIVQAYDALGHKNTTAHKLLEVLDTCQKEFETIAGECLV